MRWQGFAVGCLALIGLEVLVSSPRGTAAFGGLATGLGNLAQKVISPTVPAFATSASTTAATTQSPPANPATSSAPAQPSSSIPMTIPPAAQPGTAWQ